jgi:probable addiction module antidote protein
MKITKFDASDYINSIDDIVENLSLALESGDTDYLLSIISAVCRSKGMAKLARQLNVSRVGLYKSLAPNGNPSFATVLKLIDLLGLKLKVEKKAA